MEGKKTKIKNKTIKNSFLYFILYIKKCWIFAGVCKIYEEHLKKRNPNTPTITYDITQLFDFLDQLTDLSCLVYQKSTNTYAPYNKDWIKEKIYVLLRRAAGHNEWNISFSVFSPNFLIYFFRLMAVINVTPNTIMFFQTLTIK